jgi:hypothetical protein
MHAAPAQAACNRPWQLAIPILPQRALAHQPPDPRLAPADPRSTPAQPQRNRRKEVLQPLMGGQNPLAHLGGASSACPAKAGVTQPLHELAGKSGASSCSPRHPRKESSRATTRMPFAAVQTFPKNAPGSTSDLAGGQYPPAAHIRLLALTCLYFAADVAANSRLYPQALAAFQRRRAAAPLLQQIAWHTSTCRVENSVGWRVRRRSALSQNLGNLRLDRFGPNLIPFWG